MGSNDQEANETISRYRESRKTLRINEEKICWAVGKLKMRDKSDYHLNRLEASLIQYGNLGGNLTLLRLSEKRRSENPEYNGFEFVYIDGSHRAEASIRARLQLHRDEQRKRAGWFSVYFFFFL